MQTSKTDSLPWILEHWDEYANRIEAWTARKDQRNSHWWKHKAIVAYLEGPLNATIPGTSRRQPSEEGEGIPPQYLEPLPSVQSWREQVEVLA